MYFLFIEGSKSRNHHVNKYPSTDMWRGMHRHCTSRLGGTEKGKGGGNDGMIGNALQLIGSKIVGITWGTETCSPHNLCFCLTTKLEWCNRLDFHECGWG